MVNDRVFVPYNFTPQDRKALEFVKRRFGNRNDTMVVLFHAYTPMPAIEADKSTVLEKMQTNLTYLMQKIKSQEQDLNMVKEQLASEGFPAENIQTVFQPRLKDVAAEIIQQASKHTCDTVVLSRKSGKVSRFFTGSVYSKVVPAMKGKTVCIVS